MNKIIATALLLSAGTALSNAETLLATFGWHENDGTDTISSSTLTVGNETWNKFSGGGKLGGAATQTFSSLSFSNGTAATGVSLSTQGSLGGSDAVASGGFTGASSTLTSAFPSDVWLGALHSGAATNATAFTVVGLISGGEYTLQVLIGSGSDWKNGTSACSLSSGATNVSVRVLDQNGNDNATANDSGEIDIAVAGGSNTASSWALLEYTFEATGDSVTFQASSGSSEVADDVGGFRLTGAFIPEPSAFGLLAGAGALALVAARRRRSRKA